MKIREQKQELIIIAMHDDDPVWVNIVRVTIQFVRLLSHNNNNSLCLHSSHLSSRDGESLTSTFSTFGCPWFRPAAVGEAGAILPMHIQVDTFPSYGIVVLGIRFLPRHKFRLHVCLKYPYTNYGLGEKLGPQQKFAQVGIINIVMCKNFVGNNSRKWHKVVN